MTEENNKENATPQPPNNDAAEIKKADSAGQEVPGIDEKDTVGEKVEAPISSPTDEASTEIPAPAAAAAPPKPEKLSKKINDALHGEIGKVIIGQKNLIDLLSVALLTRGHVLIEGVPGVAKTTTAKLFSKSINSAFSRIQFTPDLMPTDVTGTAIFNVKNSEFEFKKGPIFANIVLVDEINRAPAKTQAGLFEVMEEKQISIDGNTYPFEDPFMVLATQNPVEQEGTYKLPEAQLDRFIFKIETEYPTLEEELQILGAFNENFKHSDDGKSAAVITPADIKNAQKEVEDIYVSNELLKYIAEIIHSTRNNPDLFLGASPRASLAILKTSKALAAIKGRDFVTPDDIKEMLLPVLNHRIMLAPDKEIEGFEVEDIITDIIKKVEVPR